MPSRVPTGLLLCLCFLGAHVPVTAAGDWPTWRYDAGRTAATPDELPAELHLHWSRDLGRPAPAWQGERWQDALSIDACYEPVVAGSRIFVPSMVTDSVAAYDTWTGAELWKFYAGGPLRFAPVAWGDRLYVASDDGKLYCLDAYTGGPIWTFNAAPKERKILGNGRVISTWPVRGGPVLADGRVYFVAGIWPFMGIFVYALDAETGRVVWVNENADVRYLMHPHTSMALSGLTPQGNLVAVDDYLLVPAGRARPACFDRRTGRFLYQWMGGLGGGPQVSAANGVFFSGPFVFDLATGDPAYNVRDRGNPRELRSMGSIVLTPQHAFLGVPGAGIRACDIGSLKTAEVKKSENRFIGAWQWGMAGGAYLEGRLLTPRTRPDTVWLKAGGRLYASGDKTVMAIAPEDGRVLWQHELPGRPGSVIAADDRLFVVTEQGVLHCFGAGERAPATHPARAADAPTADGGAAKVLEAAGVTEGHALVLGPDGVEMLEGLAVLSRLQVIAVEPDPVKAAKMRRRLDAAGLYGKRVSVLVADPLEASLPPYFAALIVAGDELSAKLPARAESVFRALRPYGGKLCFKGDGAAFASGLPGTAAGKKGDYSVVVRAGGPEGAGSWTHEDGDAARSHYTGEERLRPPLGILWFGGPGGGSAGFRQFIAKHQRQPRPQIASGRMIVKGVGGLRAVDIYTGRLLWHRALGGLPLDEPPRRPFTPGARILGGTHVTLDDAIYVNTGDIVLRLDPATSETVGEFELPAGDQPPPHWGYVAVDGDVLLAGARQLNAPLSDKKDAEGNPKRREAAGVSRLLVAMDRRTGRAFWQREAAHAFTHNTIVMGGGKVFCIDAPADKSAYGFLPDKDWAARSIYEDAQLLALDAATGNVVWSTGENVFGNRMFYSESQDVLVQAGDAGGALQRFNLDGRLAAHRGATGRPLWQAEDPAARPHFLLGDAIWPGETYKTAHAYDLNTGASRLFPQVERTMGTQCSGFIPSGRLLFFRSSTAAWSDIANAGGTVNIGGVRPGCTENIIPAGGIVSIESMYAAGCGCTYQIQTSLALIHDPDAEMWSSGAPAPQGPFRIGLNLGAPGDRLADDGTLWVDYPSVGGPSPYTIEKWDARDVERRTTTIIRKRKVETIPGELETCRRHSLRLTGGGLKWVAASGVKGLRSLTMKVARPGRYTVRLHFAEIEGAEAGARLFDAAIQGRTVLERFDIVKEAGGPLRAVVREFRGVEVRDGLTVELKPVRGETFLSGIEVLPE